MTVKRTVRVGVLDPGILTSVQGPARFGKRQWGVAGGGPWDQEAFRLVNSLVNNPESTPVLEMTLRGPTLKFEQDTWIVCVGGLIDCDLPRFKMGECSQVKAGEIVRFGYSRVGIRTYLAVQGGFEEKLHGVVLEAGTHLSLTEPGPIADSLILNSELDMTPSLIMAPGPDFHVFEGKADSGLRVWLEPQSNRQAILLKAKTDMAHDVRSDWSRPLFPGFVQLLPSGTLAVIGPDGHTMGGYPRVGILNEESYSRLGRLRPGTKIEITLN